MPVAVVGDANAMHYFGSCYHIDTVQIVYTRFVFVRHNIAVEYM